MKKEIECIKITPEIVKKLINFLNDNSKTDNSKAENNNTSDGKNNNLELKDSMVNLLNNVSSVLVIELDSGNKSDFYDDFTKVIKTGELSIYVNEHRVTKNDEEITLTPKEFEILYLLAKNKGTVFTKEQIYQAIWKEDYLLDEGTIMSFIRKLRKKIEKNPDDPEYIITVWGIGYKFSDKI